MNLPEPRQWRDLFRSALKIRVAEPWRLYKKTEIFTLKFTEGEVRYVSILGAEDSYYGVAVYRNEKELQGFWRIQEAGEVPPVHVVLENQECVTVYFGERDILSPGDRSGMELGEYEPAPGPLNQIFFRTYTPGLAPWYIDAEEAKVLTECLTLLDKGLEAAKKAEAGEEGQGLCFVETADGVEVELATLPEVDLGDGRYIVRNEVLIAKLKKAPRIPTAIELETAYISSPMMDGDSPRPCFPRMVALADHDQGIIEMHKILGVDQDIDTEIVNVLREYILGFGRPRLLIIRENGIYSRVCDLCRKLNISIEERNELEIIDDFLGLIAEREPEM